MTTLRRAPLSEQRQQACQYSAGQRANYAGGVATLRIATTF
jgi:hypothetical protein